MPLGQYLLSNALGALATPSNPVTEGLHVDANGNFVDANGKPALPYNHVNFFQRAFSPEARAMAQANAQYQLQAPMAERDAVLARGIKRKSIAQDVGTIPSQ